MEVELDDEQKGAVEYEGGPLLIKAGPGSGKTMVLTERVRHLVGPGKARPEEILCLTFTDKAAGEMRKRLERFGMDTSNMDVGTFHSFAKKVLEDNELDTGLDTGGGVIEKAEAVVWAINHIDDFGLESVEVGNNAFGLMRTMMDGVSTFAKALLTPDDIDRYVDRMSPGKSEDEEEELGNLADLGKVYRVYQEFKREKHVIDYDDMVAETIRLFEKKPSIRRRYCSAYKHILVDELQDNNLAQFHLVKMLADGGNVTGVGDEDQSIYSFQGAYADIFADFESSFGGTRRANLTTNYRSTENIVRATNDWMQKKAGTESKVLHSASGQGGDKIIMAECKNEQAEAEYVAKRINELAGRPSDGQAGTGAGRFCDYGDIAVLTRKKIDGEKFEEALAERGIPARYIGSTDLLYDPAVRDLMAHVKVAAMPATSGVEITHLMKLRGITERNIARINLAAKARMISGSDSYKPSAPVDDKWDAAKAEMDGGSVGEGDCVLATIKGEDGGRPKTTQSAEMRELEDLLNDLVEAGNGSLPVDRAVYKIMMAISGMYRRAVADNTRQGKKQVQRLNNVYHIAQAYAKLYPGAGLEEFVGYMYQMGEQDDEARYSFAAENAVEITTIHQSKGREFKVVFVADVSARKLPVAYRKRKFDVPEGLSNHRGAGGAAAEDRKKEMHLNEERRLLYVAMTRAKSKLFITRAKSYGENTTESKPSAFLGKEELCYKSNPHMEVEEYEGSGAGAAIEEPSVAERRTREAQAMAIASIGGMSLKTAVRHIVELSRIKHHKEHGSLDGFDPNEVLAADGDGADDGQPEWLDDPEADRQGLIDADSFEFSASKIDLYKKCPLQFKFRHALHVPGRPGAPMDIGASVHAVLEKMAKRRTNGEDTSEEQALDLLKKHWRYTSFDNKKRLKEGWDDAVGMIRTFMEWDQKAAERGVKIVGVEQEFKMDVGGLKFKGKMDRVDKEPGGQYVVTDYKTGKKPTKMSDIGHDVQMNLYALATESVYGKLPARTGQLFVRTGKEVTNEINAGALAEEKESMLGMAKAILDGQFPANPSYAACHWCDYVQICDDRYPGSEKRR